MNGGVDGLVTGDGVGPDVDPLAALALPAMALTAMPLAVAAPEINIWRRAAPQSERLWSLIS